MFSYSYIQIHWIVIYFSWEPKINWKINKDKSKSFPGIRFPYFEICVQKQWGHEIVVVLVEDSYTGDPSWIIVVGKTGSII